MTRILLDGNIYNKVADDPNSLALLRSAISDGRVVVVATPRVVDELHDSPFAGVPEWFPVTMEPESVVVLGHARLGMARLGRGEVFTAHRGDSRKTKHAIIADSADSIADLFVSEDHRCRNRLSAISTSCRAMTYDEFKAWLAQMTNDDYAV